MERPHDPSGLRNPLLWGDVCKAGSSGVERRQVHAHRTQKEACGEYYTVKEGHRHEVLSYVMENDEDATASAEAELACWDTATTCTKCCKRWDMGIISTWSPSSSARWPCGPE